MRLRMPQRVDWSRQALTDRIIRHPIYTAACLFGWGAIVVHWSLVSVALGLLLLLGALVRMICEEHLVKQTYPEYVEYAKVTKRMVPYLF